VQSSYQQAGGRGGSLIMPTNPSGGRNETVKLTPTGGGRSGRTTARGTAHSMSYGGIWVTAVIRRRSVLASRSPRRRCGK
jgi:hypothetical protein